MLLYAFLFQVLVVYSPLLLMVVLTAGGAGAPVGPCQALIAMIAPLAFFTGRIQGLTIRSRDSLFAVLGIAGWQALAQLACVSFPGVGWVMSLFSMGLIDVWRFRPYQAQNKPGAMLVQTLEQAILIGVAMDLVWVGHSIAFPPTWYGLLAVGVGLFSFFLLLSRLLRPKILARPQSP